MPTPHPDFFTALLWRQIVGAAPLASTLAAAPSVNATLGAYAWCAAPSAGPPGSVAVAYINLAADAVALSVEGVASSSPRLQYVLTAPGGNLTADAVLLNGAPLGVDGAGRLPAQPIPGAPVAAPGPLSLPPFSYGFFVLTGADAGACGGRRALP